jgi:hypothetical protein
VANEVVEAEVVDGALVEEAAPCSAESPHDTANSTTTRPSTKPVLGDSKSNPPITGP